MRPSRAGCAARTAAAAAGGQPSAARVAARASAGRPGAVGPRNDLAPETAVAAATFCWRPRAVRRAWPAWLENHRLFGPLLRDWRLHGVVLRRTKWAASLSMLLALSILLLTVDHLPSVLFAAAGMSCGALFIWTRPEKPRAR
ncbi:YbaN family protein [Pseudomonas sp. KHPS1]|nr:DUF454 family protein [Pseudomonas sp. KHPS1]UTH38902.1 YbaN family protein [Pseudomonas sp. KHPS1]